MVRPRLIVAVALAALGLGLASGCSTLDPNAATVNGTEVNRRTFVDDLDALRTNRPFVEASPVSVQGELAGSASTGFAASELSNRILFTLVDQEFARRRLTVDPEVAQVGAQMVPGAFLGAATENAGEIVASLPAGYRDRLQTSTAKALTLAMAVNQLTPQQLPAYYDQNKAQFQRICLAGVFAASEANAQAAVDALEAGTDIATVVTQYSAQPGLVGPNGELDQTGSCFRAEDLGSLGEQLAAAQPGDVIGPLDTGQGLFAVCSVSVSPRATSTRTAAPSTRACSTPTPGGSGNSRPPVTPTSPSTLVTAAGTPPRAGSSPPARSPPPSRRAEPWGASPSSGWGLPAPTW